MKIFVVNHDNYDQTEVFGTFSTKELAQEKIIEEIKKLIDGAIGDNYISYSNVAFVITQTELDNPEAEKITIDFDYGFHEFERKIDENNRLYWQNKKARNLGVK